MCVIQTKGLKQQGTRNSSTSLFVCVDCLSAYVMLSTIYMLQMYCVCLLVCCVWQVLDCLCVSASFLKRVIEFMLVQELRSSLCACTFLVPPCSAADCHISIQSTRYTSL